MIGFGSAEAKAIDDATLMSKMIPEDLQQFGLIPEFIGRLPVIATLEQLDEQALYRILTEPKNAIVKQYTKMVELDDVELKFEDDALIAIAEEAIERKTGARGLRSIIENIMLDVMYELPSLEEVTECVITKDAVIGKAQPTLYRADGTIYELEQLGFSDERATGTSLANSR